MNVFDQIFVAEEYACLLDLQQVSIVIDLGAHVGFTAAFFLSCFAGSRLIAVEPDDRNFELCRRNLAPYGDRPRLLHGAVWSRCTELSLSRATSRAGLESARQVKELELEPIPCGGRIEAWDMAALIEMAQCRTVDLLKVDIERAELELFREVAPAWLHKVRNLCIELHGADCEAVFFRSLSAFDYDLCRSGELTICRNIRRKTALTAFPAVR
jgi:FkbM family methyltransferase